MSNFMERPPRVLRFSTGVVVGFLVAALFVVGCVQAAARRGVRVKVPVEPIAAQVRQEVRDAVRRELPEVFGAARQAVPRRVADDVSRRLTETNLNVGGIAVPVPAAVAAMVRSRVEDAVRAGFDIAVNQLSPNDTAERLGEQAYSMVKARMTQAVGGKVFMVQPWPFITIPVTIEPTY